MLDLVKNEVFKLLKDENSGHGFDHIKRVYNLALKFAQIEEANVEVVSLIALLHDVDDYKLVGVEKSKNLYNANQIMNLAKIDESTKNQVIEAILTIGYSKSLAGIRPKSIEGMIVSDADMCDALGANGILRTYAYNMSKRRPFFDRKLLPQESSTIDEYRKKGADTSINHIFDKILKLKDMMLTEAGRKEAIKRHQIVVDFLYHFFEEEDAKEWTTYLNEYLNKKK